MARRAPLNNFILSTRAQLAGVTFTAAFVGEEVRQPLQHIAQVGTLVEDHDGAGAEGQVRRAQVFKGQDHVQVFLSGKRACGAAHEHGLKFAPRFQSAGEIEQQMA